MAGDSLDIVSYYRIALWLTGRLEPFVRPRKRTQEPVSAYTLPKYTPEEKELLLAHLRNKREAI